MNRNYNLYQDIKIERNILDSILNTVQAASNFYGVIPILDLYNIYCSNYEEVDLSLFINIVTINVKDNVSYYLKNIDGVDTLLLDCYYNDVEAYDRYLGISKTTKNNVFYNPGRDDLLKYKRNSYIDENESFNNVVSFFNKFCEYKIAYSISDDVQLLATFQEGVKELEKFFFIRSIHISKYSYKEFISLYEDLLNNVRTHYNKGYTNNELGIVKKIEITTEVVNVFKSEVNKCNILQKGSLFSANSLFEESSKKIGRNDPCYCGSGKKYKKCCM